MKQSMKQPNLSIVNEDLVKEFPQLNEDNSDLIVARIGDSFMASNGEEQVPVLMVQKASRFGGDDFASIARGWNGRILRKVENFTTAKAASLKITEGTVFKNYHISVIRTLEPTFPGQDSMKARDGVTERTSKGKPVYESYTITANAPKDHGIKELVLDPVDSGVNVRV